MRMPAIPACWPGTATPRPASNTSSPRATRPPPRSASPTCTPARPERSGRLDESLLRSLERAWLYAMLHGVYPKSQGRFIMKLALQSLTIVACVALQACSILSPYTPVAEVYCSETTGDSKPDPKSGKEMACHFSREYESNAITASYYSSTSTIALAGVLGLGAYKAAVASSGHQYLALAAGGGALYGTGLALYKPTREQIWMGGSAAMSCLIEFYSVFDTKEAVELYGKNHTALEPYEGRYNAAIKIAHKYDLQMKTNIRITANAVNRLQSNLQPTTAESYKAVSDAVQESMPSKDKNLRLDDNVDPNVLAVINWIDSVEERHAEIQRDSLKPQCSIFSSDFVIAGFPSNGKLTIKIGETKNYQILDGSGFFTIKSSPESTAIESKFESNNGIRSIVLKGKTKTTAPVFLTFIDSDTGVSRTLEVTVTD